MLMSAPCSFSLQDVMIDIVIPSPQLCCSSRTLLAVAIGLQDDIIPACITISKSRQLYVALDVYKVTNRCGAVSDWEFADFVYRFTDNS